MNTEQSSKRGRLRLQRKVRSTSNSSSSAPLYQGEARIWIAAPPQAVYRLVSDITRMGTYSPECYRCEWLHGATLPVPGAIFRGYNKWRGMSWSRLAEVLVAEPGREFTFRTIPGTLTPDSTVWSYRFEPMNNGTQVTESYALMYAGLMIRLLERYSGRPEEMPAAMQLTLQRIKAVAENGQDT